MGTNSTDALEQFMEDYLSRCYILGGKLITPGRDPRAQNEVFVETGGHPVADPATQLDGVPDLKRGQ